MRERLMKWRLNKDILEKLVYLLEDKVWTS